MDRGATTGLHKVARGRMNRAFSPLETFQSALRNWWLLVVLMILGAGVGELIHAQHPPIYEAKAELSTSIDFARTGSLSDIEQDQIIGIAGDVITSSAVLEKVVGSASELGIALDVDQFREISQAERQYYRWVLRVRHAQPETAARLANLWQEYAYAALEEAYGHAVIADGLFRYLDALQSCLGKTAVNGPMVAQCNQAHLKDVQAELAATGAEATREKLAAQGISPALGFMISSEAAVPSQPVQYQRSQLFFSGALIGLVLAVWAVYLNLPERLGLGKKRDG